MAKQPFVPVAKVLRVRYSGTNQGAAWVNLFHVQYSGSAPNGNDLNTLAGQLASCYGATVVAAMHSGCSLTETQVWDLSSDTGAEGIDQSVHNGQTSLVNPHPASAAVCVSWPVAKRWRGGHFRTYVTGTQQTEMQDGRLLTGAAATTWQSAANDFRSQVNAETMTGGTITLGGVQYLPLGRNPDGTPVTRTSGQFYGYSSPVVRHRLDTQRRRLGKEIQ